MDDIREIPIDRIRVKKRIRKDLGNLIPLMQSLKKYGQLSPIVITPRFDLIAGHRRWESAKRLGWNSIKAIIVDLNNPTQKLEIELEENIQRKSLTSKELSNGLTRLQKLKHPGILKRLLNGISGFRFGRLRRQR